MRTLPDVTHIHGGPEVAAEAAQSPIESRCLDFSNLDKVYPTPQGPLPVIEDFDLKVNKGEFITLIGHSGCGKSTVLTMAAE
jgi:nitrate/nitrite transport system ATP-binding protein